MDSRSDHGGCHASLYITEIMVQPPLSFQKDQVLDFLTLALASRIKK